MNYRDRNIKYGFKCVSMSPGIVDELKKLTKRLENDTGMEIGESFIVRVALSELFSRKDVDSLIVRKKIEVLRKRFEI